jgi:hypothetical protein
VEDQPNLRAHLRGQVRHAVSLRRQVDRDPAQAIIAQRIIELAGAGEHDPDLLCERYCSNSLSQRLKPAEYHLIDLATGLSLANTHARKPCRPGKSSAELFASSSTIRGRPTTSDNAGSPAAPGWPGAADVRRAGTLPKVIKRADILG